MLFRNLQMFQLVDPLPFDAEQFELRLSGRKITPCAKTAMFSFGWCSPFGDDNEVFMHAANGYFLFCAQREEKILPASVIREALIAKVQEVEQRDQRQVYRKERLRLRDEVILDLLPRAFIRKQKTFVYLDPHLNLLLIDTPAYPKAENITILLRETLGKLNVIPIETIQSPTTLLSEWLLRHQCPAGFEFDDNCEMLDVKRGDSKIKCTAHDLTTPEITNHLKNGKQAISLGLRWREKIALVLEDDFSIKRIRYLDLLRDQQKGVEAEDALQQLDADFTLMALELTQMLGELLQAFGGLKTSLLKKSASPVPELMTA